MKKVTEVQSLTVGTKYLVPCFFPFRGTMRPKWYPILLAESTHTDPDLGVTVEHLHYDSRFIADKDLLMKDGQPYIASVVVGLPAHHTWEQMEESSMIVWKKRTCYRKEQAFPQPQFERLVTDKIKGQYAYTRMENMTCPHRRTCMKGHPIKNIDGKQGVTCPAHGLTWNIETGFLI
jgi:nitrite reductase/ring-hydroxylating ferredoxin subunit